MDVPPLLPKLKAFWSASLMPVEPEPTPKKTNPSAKTSAQALEEQLLLPLRRLVLVRSRRYG